MKLEVIGKSVDVTPTMRDQAARKLQKIADLFSPRIQVDAVVVYKVHPKTNEQSCEATLSTDRLTLRAKARGTDAYECLDLCIDKLAGQMRRAKTRFERNRDREVTVEFGDIEPASDVPVEVTKVKRLDLAPMDVSEAIARMDALGHSFFAYLDSSTGLVNILYTRDDGTFGRIELSRE